MFQMKKHSRNTLIIITIMLGREATNQQTHVGPVVKVSAPRAADLSSSPAFPVAGCPGGVSGHTGDIDIATPVTTLPGAWR